MKFAGFNLKQKHSVLQSMGYKGKANNKEMNNFIKSTPGNSNAYDMAVQVATDAVGGTIKKMAKGGVVGYAHGGLHETTGEEAVDGLSSDPPEDDVQREETVIPKTPEEIAAEAKAAEEAKAKADKEANDLKNKTISDMSYKSVSDPTSMATKVTTTSMTEKDNQILGGKTDAEGNPITDPGQVGTANKATATKATAAQAATPATVTPETISASAVAGKTKQALEGGVDFQTMIDKVNVSTKGGIPLEEIIGEISWDAAAGKFKTAGREGGTDQTGMPIIGTPPKEYTPEEFSEEFDTPLATTGGVQAAQGELSDDAKVTAAKGSLSSTGTDDIAQIDDPTQVVPPPARKIEEGEMISGSAVDMAAVKEATDIQAATADPSKKATVKGQLEGLMGDFEGGATPAWAAGAMRAANAQMAARGLGSSSMAGQAIIQAAMESAIPIAQQDASTVASFEAQNLSNRQQTALFAAQQRADFLKLDFTQEFQARVTNAAKISDIANMNFTADQQVALENARLTQTANLANMSAVNAKVMADAAAMSQMDLTNLSNEQQAAVQNAQNFLQVDMANLNNSQQTSMFKAQAIQQALLTDVAAENAAKQFNATSKNQTNQFMASLNSQVSQFNTTQTNAMNQFNAGETNAISKFNSEMQNQRDQFNATNSLVVAQANAQWRQNISTLNTSAENEANMANAKFENGLTENAINQIWQRERDMMAYAFTAGESLAERNLKIVVADKNLTSVRTQLDAAEDSAKSEFMYRFLFS